MPDPTSAIRASGSSATATTTVTFTAQPVDSLLTLHVVSDAYNTTSGASRPESTGWTKVTPEVAANHGATFWYKVSDGTETSVAYTLTVTANSVYTLLDHLNVGVVTPLIIANSSFLNTTGLTITSPTVTPVSGMPARVFAIGQVGGGHSSSSFLTPVTWNNSYVAISDQVNGAGSRFIVSTASLAFDATGSNSTDFIGSYEVTLSAQSRTAILAIFSLGGGAIATGVWGGLAGAVTAVVVVPAVTTSAWGVLANAAAAGVTVPVVTAAAWGPMPGAVSAIVASQIEAVPAGVWGSLVGAAAAFRPIPATGSGVWGGLVGAAAAFRLIPAVTAGPWGVLSSTATVSFITHPVVTVGTWGSLTGAVVVHLDMVAVAVGNWGALVAVVLTARVTVHATAAAAWGGLAEAATAVLPPVLTPAPTIHVLVGAQFADQEVDVGKSIHWLTWFADDLFILDVNLGTTRYWVVNWTASFPAAKHHFTGINFFINPAAFRREQWARFEQAYGTADPDSWVLWVDAHEGFSVDNRSLPDDYDILPFQSFVFREVTRAQTALEDSVVLPVYVFLRSDEVQNITYTHPATLGDPPTQSISTPYYLPHLGLRRLWKAEALQDPSFDWTQLDTFATPSAGVKAQLISYAYAHWNPQDIVAPATEVPALTEDNDAGWRMRKLISLVRPVPGLGVDTWVDPSAEPLGVPGPWGVDGFVHTNPALVASVYETGLPS